MRGEVGGGGGGGVKGGDSTSVSTAGLGIGCDLPLKVPNLFS